MPGSHLFNLGLFQKNFLSTSKVSGAAVNMGCTRGRGSTTRMLNYCNTHSPNPSLCIYNYINYVDTSYKFKFGNFKLSKNFMRSDYSSDSDFVSENPVNFGVSSWFNATCSYSGQYIYLLDANVFNPTIYVSNDYGKTFTNNATSFRNYSGIATNNNGSLVTIAAIRDFIFYSNNYGQTFTETNNPGGFWFKTACSSNGQIVAMVKNFNNSGGSTPNPIFISTNYAASFVQSISEIYSWSSICMNGNGNIIATCSYDGYVYITINQGSTWVSVSNLPEKCWSSISMDSTGQNIVLCSLDGKIYISNNTGNTWTFCAPINAQWSSICISATANVIFVCAINDYIYYSSNNGVSWTKTSPNGIPSNWSNIITNYNGSLVCSTINGGNIYIMNNVN